MFVAITEDSLVLRNLARAGNVTSAKSFAGLPQIDELPSAVVIDLDIKDALPVAAQVKARWANTLIAGFLSYPNRKLWESAEAAGFDLVTTRGALAAQLNEKLSDWQGRSKQRVRVCDVADLAGRLGVVARLSDLPMGPVAVYHIGGEVFAAQDVCPHAGAQLSQGELSGAIITCPRHGSQFDVRTGERVRGPADLGIETYRVEMDGGQVFVVKDEG
ncbi:MAG: non-heme iron oxygenase ferredoxin subunit [Chloroflexi bacterium]|nr:non-heme iron oxygenase ferredoxin subunit [Chloroflexota bacterium]